MDFEKKMPAFINPEDIMANVLLLNGHNPDIKTIRLGQAEQTVTISSAAKIQTKMDNESLAEFEIPANRFIRKDSTKKPFRLTANHSRALNTPPMQWWQPDNSDRVYITTPHQTWKFQLNWGSRIGVEMLINPAKRNKCANPIRWKNRKPLYSTIIEFSVS